MELSRLQNKTEPLGWFKWRQCFENGAQSLKKNNTIYIYIYVLRFTKPSQSIHYGNLHIEHKLFNAPHPKCSNQPWIFFSGLNIHPTSSIPPIPANINPRIINPDPDCSQVGQLPLTNITVKEYDKILFEKWKPPISILGETVALLILGQRKRRLLLYMPWNIPIKDVPIHCSLVTS